MGRSSKAVQATALFLLCLLSSLGICINKEKSTWTPTKTINFIGAALGTTAAKAYLLIERFEAMNNLIRQVTLRPWATVKVCLSLLGHVASFTYIKPFSRLHFCCLQAWLWSIYSPDRHNRNTRLTVSARVTASLVCGMNPEQVHGRVPFLTPIPDATIIMYASLI